MATSTPTSSSAPPPTIAPAAYNVRLQVGGVWVQGYLVGAVSLPAAVFANGLSAQANGFIYTGAIPTPVWSAMVGYLNQTTAVSINILTSYVTPNAGTTLSAPIVNGVPGASLPTGWAFNSGTTLTYNGTSVNAQPFTLQWIATNAGISSPSPVINCQGQGSASTDTTPPTVPLNVAVTTSTTTAQVTWNQSCDNAPPGTVATNLGNYTVHVQQGGVDIAGSPFSVAPGGTQVLPTWTVMDRGTQTSSITQTGNDLAITTTAIDPGFPTALASGGGGYSLNVGSAAQVVVSCEIDAFTSAAAFDNLGLEISSSLATNAQQVAIRVTPTNQSSPQVLTQYVQTVGASQVNLASSANPGLPIRLFAVGTMATNVWAFYWSNSGNALQPLGSVTVVLGSTLLIRAVGNLNMAGTLNGTIKQLCISVLPQAQLNLTGLSASTAYSVSSLTAQDQNGTPNVSASAAAVSFSTGSTTTAQPFPRPSVMAIGTTGSGDFPTSADILFSQFSFVILGGNFPSFQSDTGRTRQALVAAIKGQTKTGKSAVTPIVYQYEDANEIPMSNPFFPSWVNAVNASNWYVYLSGSSGTRATSTFGSNLWTINPADVVGKDSNGNYPYESFALLLQARYLTGTLGEIGMVATNLDGFFIDDFGTKQLSSGNADWLRTGTAISVTDPTGVAATTAGKARFATKWASLGVTQALMVNSEPGASNLPSSDGSLNLNGSNIANKFGSQNQFLWSTAGASVSGVCQWGTPAINMAWYKAVMGFINTGGIGCITGGVLSSDSAIVRAMMCMALMDNGYPIFATNASTSGQDFVTANNLSTFPSFDEFWGASLGLAGFLGNPLNTSQGAVQTGPTITANGDTSPTIWCRDFQFGTAYWNPSGVSKTFNTLRPQFRLNGSGPVNTGGGAITSITIGPGASNSGGSFVSDGAILMNTKPP